MDETNLVSSVGSLISVIKPDLIWMVLQSSIAIFIILLIKDYLTSAVDLMTFRSSKYVCIGTRIRIPHPTGFNDCEITDVNRKFITLENKEVRILMPLKTFKEHQWTLIKSPSQTINDNSDIIATNAEDINTDDTYSES